LCSLNTSKQSKQLNKVNKMNGQQMQWASQHDWFVDAFEHNGSFTVEVINHDFSELNGHVRNDITFTDFSSLRIWAGY
jgi:hypothetical protein